jgi:Cdc6-like AAA superfamily ATPase
MDIEQYLAEQQRRLNNSKDHVRRFEVFDFNYIPEKPLMREEVKPAINALIRYRQTGIANNVLILGARGSGKSVLAKYLMNALSERGHIDFAYANCRQHNTSFKILASLLGVRPRGCSLDELWQKLSWMRAI